MAEWLKAPVLKTGKGVTPSWVRIPPHPPSFSVLSMEILLGTTNKEKISEFLATGGFSNFLVKTFADFSFNDVEETGTTLKENALLKARYGFIHTGIPTFSDDTGFFVHALNDFPGIFAARIAGKDKNFKKAKESIAEKLKQYTDKSATFSTALAYVDSKETIIVQGDVQGTYVYGVFPSQPDYHGYRDAFLPDGAHKTIADMSVDEKGKYSPRQIALSQLFDQLEAKGVLRKFKNEPK